MNKDIALLNKETEERRTGSLQLYLLDDNKVALTFSFASTDEHIEANDYFDCLTELRNRLSPLNWILLCNGARKDVYPSGMQRSMAKGLKAFKLTMGVKPDNTDVVDIFDEADEKDIVSVKEQEAFYKEWLAG